MHILHNSAFLLFVNKYNKLELTNQLTPCSRVLPEKLPGNHLLKKSPKFYGTGSFISAFKSARYLSLS